MKKISTQNDTLSENLRKRVVEHHSPLLRAARGLPLHRRTPPRVQSPIVDVERPLDACDEPKDRL